MAEIGAIASIVGIAAAGAKLSMVLFEFGSTVGSARSEVNQIASEISQFCAVLKQLHSTLTGAKARRYSISAIATTQDILMRCQDIFNEIEDIMKPLQKSAGKSKEPSLDAIARVKWTFRRSKVQVLQKTLESSKNTLQLMLLVLDLARKTASSRASTINEQIEDQQEQAIIQGLIAAQRCTVDQLETLESEAEEQDAEEQDTEQVTPILSIQSPETQITESTTRNRERVTSNVDVQQGGIKLKRASAWVSDLIFDNSPLPSGFRRNTWGDNISSPNITSQARRLVQVWTERVPEIADNSNQNQEKNPELSIEGTKEGSGNKLGPLPEPPIEPKKWERLQALLYVRAKYDYGANDRTTLSFHKGDIIEVISQSENGWWDGVINGVRGWFPSNYCRTLIELGDNLEASDEESDGEESYDDESYDDESDDDENGGVETGELTKEHRLMDFWIPQATPDGRLFYLNVENGETTYESPI